MGLNAIAHAARVRGHVRAIHRWSKTYRVVAHVPVDSPAANFPVCRDLRRGGARVVHLAAPQLWAWGSWRIGKLRRRTDLVLCLLPFEEQWFRERDVPARFIGHPRLNRAIDEEALAVAAHDLPQGSPHIALFPGSRAHEVKANLRLLANAFAELQGRHSGAVGIIAAASPEIEKIIRRRLRVFPTGMHLVTARPDVVITWAELCLAVSGTVTLDITRQRKAMIGVYKTSTLAWLAAKFLLRTPYRLLPNLIADREIVPEYVPYAGGAGRIVEDASRILRDSKHSAVQAQSLARICQRYVGKKPALEAARWI
jgi:lipid-A-disaccharide synthase